MIKDIYCIKNNAFVHTYEKNVYFKYSLQKKKGKHKVKKFFLEVYKIFMLPTSVNSCIDIS